MKAMVMDKYGKHPLRSAEIPMPAVGDHDILVEIHAASVNPLDLLVRNGKLRIMLKYEMPHVLGYDFSGVVIQAGRKVRTFKVGDEVYGRPSKGGAFAEYISVNEDDIALKPRNLTFEEAASIPLVGLTSYQVLHEKLKLKTGQKVLIQAGSGGVGTFAIQLAKAMGLYVATTTSEAGVQLVESLGADRVINYKTEHFDELLQGYDAVLDTKGGETLEKAFKIVKTQGQIVSLVGPPNARFGEEEKAGFVKTSLFRLISRKFTKLEKKYKVKYSFLFMKPSGKQLALLTDWMESDKIKPVIDRVYPFEDTQKAIEYSESGRAKGKIIIKMK
ncbi:NADP-dependent oxidoreductase [Paenibacillus sp. strain BS8-2]